MNPLEVDINEVLQLKNFTETLTMEQIISVGYANDFQLPLVYSKLFNQNRISLNEYKFLKELWEFSVRQVISQKIRFPAVSMIKCMQTFFDVNLITKSHRNSFENTLTKLQNMQLIIVTKPKWGQIQIELNTSIFDKMLMVLSRHYSDVNLYSVLYLKTCDYEFRERYNKLCSKIGVKYVMPESNCEEIIRTPIKGVRQPIIGIREPILGLRKAIFITQKVSTVRKRGRKIDFSAKKYQGLTEDEKKQLERISVFGRDMVDRQLRQIRKRAFGGYTEDEEKCITEFVPYYENLICKVTGRVEFSVLNHATHKKASRNWTPLWKCYKLCIDNNWDWRIYLDAQFESFKNWDANMPYPMPNMLYTDRALKAYENYIYHNETAYQNEGWETKVSAQNTGTFQEEVKKVLDVDLSVIEDYIKYSLKRSFNKTFKKVDKTRPDLDNLYYSKAVQSQWESLSVECWVNIPQMSEFLSSIYGRYASIDAKIDEYRNIMDNSKKVEIIQECWKSMKVPTLIGIIDIDKKLENL